MFIANHFFVRIGVSAYSNNQKNKFYSNYNNHINNNTYIYFSFKVRQHYGNYISTFNTLIKMRIRYNTYNNKNHLFYKNRQINKSYFDQILRNEQESIRLTILRDTLLPKLMSGELKINATEVL